MLGLIAGEGHADAGRPPLGQIFQSNAVFHGAFILSQLCTGRVQEAQPLPRLRQEGLQHPLLLRQMAVQLLPSAVLQQRPDGGQAEAHVPQGGDAPRRGELLLAVVAVAGERVGVDGLEQPQLVVAAQHADAEPGQLGKGTDFQHGRFLTYM